MKKKWMVTVLLMAIVSTAIVLVDHNRQMKRLNSSEKNAMENLPGFQIRVNGECIKIKRKWTHEAFLSQHWAIPFLENIMPRIQYFEWTKERPLIEITETESTIIIVIPIWPPPPPNAAEVGWCGWDYTYKIIFDKATGKKIWARRCG